MSQAEKSRLYKELQAAGASFTKHYREYSTDELAAAVAQLRQRPGYQPPANPAPETPSPVSDAERLAMLQQAYADTVKEAPTVAQPPPTVIAPPEEMAGLRAYQEGEGEKPIRTDEQGRVWYREEVLKPAFPKPRARRRLTYIDTGATTKTVANGQFMESFEVAGNERRQAEVRITLPSYQVGVYKDPRMPFKVHVYNGNRGFDYFDVQKFYGGTDMVPDEIKTVYVGNDLCYDIRTTIRAIETEYRRQQLAATKGM